jgi:Cu(I)/Ag(I) efflux system periplasmic protein CusF
MKATSMALKSATLFAGALLALSAFAQTTGDMASGEIRKVDKDAAKLTIKHGDIKSLDMPAMTMVFQVRDPALLDKLKAGDKVKFSAERRDGAFVVNAIEAAP